MERSRHDPAWVQLVAAFFREDRLSAEGALVRALLYSAAVAALAGVVIAELVRRLSGTGRRKPGFD
jgi:hypothetical protein